MDFELLKKKQDELALKQEKQAEKKATEAQLGATIKGAAHVAKTIAQESAKSRAHTQKVEVVNQPTLQVNHTNDYAPVLSALKDLQGAIKQLAKDIVIPENEPVETVSVDNLKDYSTQLSDVIKAVKSIKVSPQVTVSAPHVTVPETTVDLTPITTKLDAVVTAVSSIKPSEAVDITPLTQATQAVKKSIESLSFPVPNYVLPFSQDGKATQVVLTATGKVPVEATINATASDGAITDGVDTTIKASVKDLTNSNPLTVAITDGNGDQITSFGGGTQYTEGDVDATITGTALMWEGAANTLKSVNTTDRLPVATGLTQPTTPSDTQPISAATLPLPSLAATSTKQSDGSQKSQIVDGSGNVISATSNALDVNIKSGASAGTEYTEDAVAPANPVGGIMQSRRKDTLSATEVSADGDIITLNATNKGQLHVKLADTVVVDGSGVTQPVSGTVTANAGTNLNTSALALDAHLTDKSQFTKITDGTDTALVTAAGEINVLATAQPGVDIGDVTINNASGASAINIQDGGNSITVDGSVSITGTPVVDTELTTADLDTGAGTDTRAVVGLVGSKSGGGVLIPGDATKGLAVDLTATGANTTALKVDGSAVTQPVSLASVPSHAVTNAGTFAVQATEADGANTTLGAKADAKSTATDTTAVTIMSVLKQISASVQAPPSQAVTNAGTFAVQATLAAETTKVIGVVRTADGSGNLLTSTSNALDVNIKTSAASNISTNTAQINGVTPLMGNGASGTGAQRVTIASDSTGQVAPAANATATGTSIYNNTALSSTKVAVNASAGNLYGYHFYNSNSVVIYIQMWNVASASVTVGTTAPTMVIAVPPSGWADAPPSGVPIAFGTALTMAATTTATGSTAPTTALLANVWYK